MAGVLERSIASRLEDVGAIIEYNSSTTYGTDAIPYMLYNGVEMKARFVASNMSSTYVADEWKAVRAFSELEEYSIGNMSHTTGGFIVHEDVVSYYKNGTSLGAIIFHLPIALNYRNSMLIFEISWYNYSLNSSGKAFVYGYVYTDNRWINYGLNIIGDNKLPFNKIRLSNINGRKCIIIGETNTSWSYIRIKIDKVHASYNNFTGWSLGWDATKTTSLASLDAAHTYTLIHHSKTLLDYVGRIEKTISNTGALTYSSDKFFKWEGELKAVGVGGAYGDVGDGTIQIAMPTSATIPGLDNAANVDSVKGIEILGDSSLYVRIDKDQTAVVDSNTQLLLVAADCTKFVDRNYALIASFEGNRCRIAGRSLNAGQNIYPDNYIVATLTSGYVNYSSHTATYEQACATLKDGVVTLLGLVKKGTTDPTSRTAFILPLGMRPRKRLIMNVYSSSRAQRLDIKPTGEVLIMSQLVGISWLSLSCSFPVMNQE